MFPYHSLDKIHNHFIDVEDLHYLALQYYCKRLLTNFQSFPPPPEKNYLWFPKYIKEFSVSVPWHMFSHFGKLFHLLKDLKNGCSTLTQVYWLYENVSDFPVFVIYYLLVFPFHVLQDLIIGTLFIVLKLFLYVKQVDHFELFYS